MSLRCHIRTLSLNKSWNPKSGVLHQIVLSPLDVIGDPIPGNGVSDYDPLSFES